MKKKYIVLLCVCLVCVGICVYLGIFHYQAANEENVDLEDLRDSLKVYQTDTAVPPPPPDTETESEPEPETETGTALPEPDFPETEGESRVTETALESETEPAETEPAETETEDTGTETAAETPPETSVPAAPALSSPEYTLDFEPLWNLNPDIYAWIEIEGTKVNYPVLQSPVNDEKYLTTAYDGSYYIGGSIFTQASYNSTDFNDPVTVIYGHTMKSGTLFGQLQTVYANAETFAAHSDIKIYLPDEVRHYTVFAAVPYESIHILYTYDFTTEYWYNNFFDNVRKIRSFNAQFNKDVVPEYGDRVIILSTCLNEDSTQRFLVMAVLQDDLAE